MKKGTRRLLIVLGIVITLPVFLLAWLIVAAIVLPRKTFVAVFYSHSKETTEPYPFADTVLPEHPTVCEGDGLRLYLPGDLTYTGTDAQGLLYTDAKQGLTQTGSVHIRFADVSATYTHKVQQVYLDEGMWAFSKDKPENEYGLWDFILNLTADQFDEQYPGFSSGVTRSKTLYATAMAAKMKAWKDLEFGDAVYRVDAVYQFETETAKGFAVRRETEKTLSAQHSLDLWLYDKTDLNRSCRALLFSEDMQLLTQIAGTAEIVTKDGYFGEACANHG